MGIATRLKLSAFQNVSKASSSAQVPAKSLSEESSQCYRQAVHQMASLMFLLAV